ncbi:uncharacterized protein SPPG_02409 [Spizellomyces punctatus DAOM BR117]|uniref:Uncharacterized protein n=1 Tax=Spizellomyces punctatus (strain DAOM BR117) TaxID=645134 RepID=A0A0L0HPN4_SPIPD|nr:uncharacterized protein SPPG_02409 [Spizellomyces punctatus DAOM BR117]KND03366.1 hypothetical protein SPPG_02409 [Spizellomyces punctatus DAOM BR117]|eukprot:XP_016611405.1 hypothetical protein SPPG_02409 [Spizellomyces punctatus DAOM BR117]
MACHGNTKKGYPCSFKDTTGYGYCGKHVGCALKLEGIPPLHVKKPSKKTHSHGTEGSCEPQYDYYRISYGPSYLPEYPVEPQYDDYEYNSDETLYLTQHPVTRWFGPKLDKEREARELAFCDEVENTKPSDEWVKRQHEYLNANPSLRQLLDMVMSSTSEFRPKGKQLPSNLRLLIKGIWEAPRTDRDIIVFHGRPQPTLELDGLRTLCTSYDYDCAKRFGGWVLRLRIPQGTPAIFIGGDEDEILLPPGFLTKGGYHSPVDSIKMPSATFIWREDLNLDG